MVKISRTSRDLLQRQLRRGCICRQRATVIAASRIADTDPLSWFGSSPRSDSGDEVNSCGAGLWIIAAAGAH
jgi:hypothetical protein